MIEKTKRADNRLTVSSFVVNPAGIATISYNWLISSVLSVWLCGSVMIWTLVDVAACLIFVRQILRFKGNEFLCNKKLFGCVL